MTASGVEDAVYRGCAQALPRGGHGGSGGPDVRLRVVGLDRVQNRATEGVTVCASHYVKDAVYSAGASANPRYWNRGLISPTVRLWVVSLRHVERCATACDSPHVVENSSSDSRGSAPWGKHRRLRDPNTAL